MINAHRIYSSTHRILNCVFIGKIDVDFYMSNSFANMIERIISNNFALKIYV